MAKEMPIKMKSKGLTIVTEPVFQEGPYFVIMMQVKHANLQVMMEASDKKKKKGTDTSDDDSSVGSGTTGSTSTTPAKSLRWKS